MVQCCALDNVDVSGVRNGLLGNVGGNYETHDEDDFHDNDDNKQNVLDHFCFKVFGVFNGHRDFGE